LDRSLSNTELALLKAFDQADQLYPEKSILFLDELDTIAPKRSTHSYSNESKTVAQLLTLMDGMQERHQCLVIAATNRPNDIDPALRRPGRFDREIEFHSPSQHERFTLLQKITKDFPMDLNETQLSELASLTNGFVAADLNLLCREAALAAVYENKDKITHAHFIHAFKNGKGPSIKREYQLTLESLDWSSLGGIDHIKKELQQHIEWPYLYPETFARLGLEPARGILLYGPPGCSKTTIAKVFSFLYS
jgi:transitional endoplasmic reticulum ATPase